MADAATIGERLKKIRVERGLSQAELAERAGCSVDLVRKLEQGVRQSARVTSLSALAHALGVSMSELLDKRPRLDTAADAANLLAVRDTVLTPSALPGIDRREDPGVATPANVLKDAVQQGWTLYWAGQFGRLAAVLPGLIGEARLSARQAGPVAAVDLAQAYQLAACLFVHVGSEDLATISAERGVVAAAEGDDELQWAMLHGTYAWALLAQGRLEEAERHATEVAGRIEPSMSSATPKHLTVWGSLLLTALAPAAAAGREAEAGNLIALARAGAARLQVERHDYQTDFGPVQVALQATHANSMLGHPRRALEAAQAVRRDGLRPIAWGRHLLDVAQSQVDARREEAALGTLQTAHAVSAEWFRHQLPARAIVADLMERRRRLTPALRSLARAVELGSN